MTEQQIYNRLNRCYLNCMVDNKEQVMTDEWYGTDDPKDWQWYRPSDNKRYRLVLNPDKTIDCYESNYEKDGIYAFIKVRIFNSKDYMYEPVPELNSDVDDEMEI